MAFLICVQRFVSSFSALSQISVYNLYAITPSPTPHSGSEYMAGPIRTTPTDTRHVQPPRPPNAWILYRSDKLRSLPPTAPGTPRRAQADVSKLISDMWKNESDYVRGEYERRADAKKAEHQALYPGYRFQPMKKEERERLREEKRLEKERDRAQSRRGRVRPGAPYATGQVVHAPLLLPLAYYPPEFRYGPEGPSPPMSAASSPPNASPYPESQSVLEEHPDSHSTVASPHPESHASTLNDMSTPASSLPNDATLASQPSQSNATNSQLGFPQSPGPGPSQWQPYLEATTSSTASASLWPNFDPTQEFTLADYEQPDFTSFNIPTLPMQNLQPWIGQGASGQNFTDPIQGVIGSTQDPAIFTMSGFDANLILDHPVGEIEVSMGNSSYPYEFENFSPSSSTDLFANFNFTPFAGPSSQTLDGLITGSSITEQTSLFDIPSGTLNSITSYNPDQFLNFDAYPDPLAPTPTPTSAPTEEQRAPASYVPPSGAPYSSTRRVAASWKQSFVDPDSSVDRSTQRAWGVPAS